MAVEAAGAKTLKHSFGRKKQLEKDLEHITKEMYRRNKELADTNRILSLLRNIDNLVLTSQSSLKELSGQIANSITSITDYPFVALMGRSEHSPHELEVYGSSLKKTPEVESSLPDLSGLRLYINMEWFRSRKKSRLLQIGHHSNQRLARILHCKEEQIDEIRQKLPLQSMYLVKLEARQDLVGVIVTGFFHPTSHLEEFDTMLLDQLGEAVGVAVDNKMLFEENQQIVGQLKKANTRLMELDKTKDEFISMASHQLRTPLTTVKGYLSMVLEGDVGPVSKNERDMIQRAFDGAERMVFLIADLLNVSRLQSGKFIIENKPTDLVKLVAAEVEQLQEAAKNHDLKLSFHKPANFPKLNLDENKILQVIMNFLDNAIYYTPKGGSIDVALQATDKEVSYTVTDTGLGVPKAEQHKLFSKFYRAGNARKMRPDGTGLGLFMAKKVIAAQGGAIIFKSEEGKGSIFGFSFPKHAVETKSKPPGETDKSESKPKVKAKAEEKVLQSAK
jgi:signal transduction histidine kinase